MGSRGVGLVDDDLGDPVAIAEVEEDQLPMVAPSMDPAGQTGIPPGIGGPQLAAGMGSIGRGEAGAVIGHGRRIVEPRVARGFGLHNGLDMRLGV